MTAHIAPTLAHLRHRAGSLGEAEWLYIDAIELLRAVDPVLAASAGGDLAALRADRGQIATAERALEGIARELDGADDPALIWVLELHRGHVDAARARAAGPEEPGEAHMAVAQARLARV